MLSTPDESQSLEAATVTPLEEIVPYGFCHCRCGEKTRISDKNYKCFGVAKGEPWRFLPGHQKKIRPIPTEAGPFKLKDVYCRVIPLSQGLHAIVDASRYLEVMKRKWYARWDKTTKGFYVVSHGETVDGKRGPLIWLHRLILGLETGDERKGDHVDPGNTLDNSSGNLRLSNDCNNAQNKRLSKNNTSGRKGVSWHTTAQKWQAGIRANGVFYDLGRYEEFEDACAAREAGEKKYHGEFARSV